MSLHLLPKKSWHVWNADNLERVRQDEAAHAAELDKQRSQAVASDQGALFEALRRRATGGQPEAGEPASPANNARSNEVYTSSSAPRHGEGPDAKKGSGQARQGSAAANAATSGVPLGEGSAETSQRKPWYLQRPGQGPPPASSDAPSEDGPSRDDRRKGRDDPMALVTKTLAKRPGAHTTHGQGPQSRQGGPGHGQAQPMAGTAPSGPLQVDFVALGMQLAARARADQAAGSAGPASGAAGGPADLQPAHEAPRGRSHDHNGHATEAAGGSDTRRQTSRDHDRRSRSRSRSSRSSSGSSASSRSSRSRSRDRHRRKHRHRRHRHRRSSSSRERDGSAHKHHSSHRHRHRHRSRSRSRSREPR